MNSIDRTALLIAERLLGCHKELQPLRADWPVLLDLVEMTREMLMASCAIDTRAAAPSAAQISDGTAQILR